MQSLLDSLSLSISPAFSLSLSFALLVSVSLMPVMCAWGFEREMYTRKPRAPHSTSTLQKDIGLMFDLNTHLLIIYQVLLVNLRKSLTVRYTHECECACVSEKKRTLGHLIIDVFVLFARGYERESRQSRVSRLRSFHLSFLSSSSSSSLLLVLDAAT